MDVRQPFHIILRRIISIGSLLPNRDFSLELQQFKAVGNLFLSYELTKHKDP